MLLFNMTVLVEIGGKRLRTPRNPGIEKNELDSKNWR